MSARVRLIVGAAGFAALLGGTVAAEAQYYPPPQGYPQQNYPPQSYPPNYPAPNYPPNYVPPNQGGFVGALLNPYRYGQYPYGNYGYNQYGNQQYGIDRCARAVEQRLNGSNYNYYQGYNYKRYRNFGRVEGITRVDRKSYGFKVFGVASSGYGGYQGWNRPGYGNYGYNAGADLRWNCKVYSGGQIRDIEIKRRTANWRGY